MAVFLIFNDLFFFNLKLLVPIEIKAEYDEAHGHEMIDLNDGDIEIIEPTGSAGSYYVTNFDSEFDEPRNKVLSTRHPES